MGGNIIPLLLVVHRFSEVRPLLPDPGRYEAEIPIAILKNYKSAVSDEINSE
jgi:hypothetical protein